MDSTFECVLSWGKYTNVAFLCFIATMCILIKMWCNESAASVDAAMLLIYVFSEVTVKYLSFCLWNY